MTAPTSEQMAAALEYMNANQQQLAANQAQFQQQVLAHMQEQQQQQENHEAPQFPQSDTQHYFPARHPRPAGVPAIKKEETKPETKLGERTNL